MAGLSLSAQGFALTIPREIVNGPLNLTETLLSGQTAEPEWLREGEGFTDVEVLDGIPVKYSLSQVGNADDFSLEVRAITDSHSPPSNQTAIDLKNHLTQVLGLKDDLNLFYRKFADKDNVLAVTFPNLRGLRLMRGTDLFKALICSILSQNNSVRLWNRSARLLMKHYGRRVNFLDGSHEYLFPGRVTLARLNPRSLRSKTSIGYRANPVVAVSRMIVNDEFDLSSLTGKPYGDAKDMLLELPGVGPKVADCFLLYGARYDLAAPVDVWIHRIVSKFYFGGRKVSKMKTAAFLRDRFGAWAGYAQLYLFDYARREKV
jgi:N-glycosylase/DNA lyase